MSSTLSKPARRQSAPARAIPARDISSGQPAAPSATVEIGDPAYEQEFQGFVRAVTLGLLIGLPLMTALLTLAVHIAAPDWPLGAAFGIAFWAALFTGVFLGGTVTVGIWSHRQEHANRHP